MAIEVEGIILKSFNYGEHHKIVKVLTENQGVIGVFVQNANKVNTKKSALVHDFLFCESDGTKFPSFPSALVNLMKSMV